MQHCTITPLSPAKVTRVNQTEWLPSGGSQYTLLLEGNWEPGANTSMLIELDVDNPELTISATILSVLNAHITLVTEVPRLTQLWQHVKRENKSCS